MSSRKFFGNEDSVVRPLDFLAGRNLYQGATISGRGNVVLILDAAALSAAAADGIGKSVADTAEIPDHHETSFFRWYESAGRESFGQLLAFQEVETPHAALHAAAAGVRAALLAGDREEALRQGGDLSRIELELLNKLDSLRAAIGDKRN